MKFLYTNSVFLILIFLIVSNQPFAQQYYPLEIGNRWDYEVYSSDSNQPASITYYSIEVIADSLFSNGKTYFVLNDYDLSGGRYIRADENFIYYFDEINFEEDTLYHLNANVGDSWIEQFSYAYYISVESIDTTDVFSESSIVMEFRLDGLLLKYVKLSDIFGPLHYYYPGEPPGTSNTIKILIGGIISGEEFGDPLSTEKQMDLDLKNFTLSQNYPNPFNPQTKIRFTIPEMEYVSLKIYDVLGNEIETLVNEEKPAGIYEVFFDATDKPSGVYFFQLKAGEFIETKKMILLR